METWLRASHMGGSRVKQPGWYDVPAVAARKPAPGLHSAAAARS
jgi:hypothetical protein